MRNSKLAAILSSMADANKLIIYHNPLGSLTFDPNITTSKDTTVFWDTEQGRTITTGTSHALSYTPTAGPKICKVTVMGGLGLISAIDCNTDAVTNITIERVKSPTSLIIYTNSTQITINRIPKTVTYLHIQASGSTGNFLDLPSGLTYLNSNSTTGLIGNILAIKNTPLQTWYGQFNNNITGVLSDLPATLQTCHLYSCSGIDAASVAQLTAARDLRFYNLSFTEEEVDLIIDSIYQAVVADANHFTYAGPIVLQIGGTGGTINAAPSGIYQEATPPTTGKEKVYFLNHLASHAWAIVYNGGP